MQLIALIHGHDGNYGVSFPDMLGCIAAGDTLAEALANAKEAAVFHTEGMVAGKLALPVPRSLDALKAEPEFAEEFASVALVTVVDFDPPTKSVRVNITLDEHLLAAIDRVATVRQSTRSGLLAEAARRHILGR